jgi:hypothetical protein
VHKRVSIKWEKAVCLLTPKVFVPKQGFFYLFTLIFDHRKNKMYSNIQVTTWRFVVVD